MLTLSILILDHSFFANNCNDYANFLDGLAWDWVNEKLYWTDYCADDLEVFDPATGDRKVLIRTGSGSAPRGVVLDPSTR